MQTSTNIGNVIPFSIEISQRSPPEKRGASR